MSKNVEILATSPFIQLVKLNQPEAGIRDYYYAQERPGIVAVLPFRLDASLNVEYLIRSELCPPWGTDRKWWTCITGGCDGDEPEVAAAREVLEESGYATTPHAMIPLGRIFSSKAVDAHYWLFAVDVSDIPGHAPMTDGSPLEAMAHNSWVQEASLLMHAEDALLYALFCRLRLYLDDLDAQDVQATKTLLT